MGATSCSQAGCLAHGWSSRAPCGATWWSRVRRKMRSTPASSCPRRFPREGLRRRGPLVCGRLVVLPRHRGLRSRAQRPRHERVRHTGPAPAELSRSDRATRGRGCARGLRRRSVRVGHRWRRPHSGLRWARQPRSAHLVSRRLSGPPCLQSCRPRSGPPCLPILLRASGLHLARPLARCRRRCPPLLRGMGPCRPGGASSNTRPCACTGSRRPPTPTRCSSCT